MAVISRLFFLLLLIVAANPAMAVVLADDRVDILYHSYDGDGVTIDGPSFLVRKGIGKQFSFHGNYYVDSVSGASVDVRATASPYTEERTEYTAGVDYLNNKSIVSFSYTNSSENDYEADTVSLGVTHDFFGDLTTVGFGLSFGDNVIRRNDDDVFEETSEQRRYKLSVSQILSKSLIANLALETVVDDGYLNNPYRQVRFVNDSARGFGYQQELYPETRNSDAVSLRLMYYLPYRASLKLEHREYSDSWNINASNTELKYVHPLGKRWLFEAKYRSYQQTSADFYQDLFAFSNATTQRARDKELSQYSTTNIGLGVTYQFKRQLLDSIQKSSFNVYWDLFNFDYDNFRDVTQNGVDESGNPLFAVGEEPLFSFDANVLRVYLSFWY